MASVWEERRRRNVVKVAIAYAVASWLLLQLKDVLAPLLNLPEWIGRLVFLLLLIGFPLALIFAWAVQLTPEGIKLDKDVRRGGDGLLHDQTRSGFRFGNWQALPLRNLLLGPEGEVHIEPKVMQVLEQLASTPGEVVERDTLLSDIWGGRAFSDEPLTRCIAALRRALGDSSKDPQYIQTIPKSGYRLVCTVELLGQSIRGADIDVAAPSGNLMSGHRIALPAILGLIFVAILYLAYQSTLVGPLKPPQLSVNGSVRLTTSAYSIAVLPFVNMSSDPEQEYFSDGLSEEILNLLSKVPSLKVIGRTSSFAFKGKNEDLRVIGEKLGVKTVLEGSVRKSGDRVRITAQLIDVSDGTRLWSDSYDRTMSDIFAVQDDVAAAIINALQIHVSSMPIRSRPTENMEAYALFLKAKPALSAHYFDESEKLLLHAVELDPDFAEAHELLAHLYARLNVQKRTHEAAAKALAINPDLAFAAALFERASDPATRLSILEAFERVLREQPNNESSLGWLTWYLITTGYLQEALHLAERRVTLEPLSVEATQDLGYALSATGRTSEALVAWELAGTLAPDNRFWLWMVGDSHLVEIRDDLAIVQFEAWAEQTGDADTSWVRDLVTGARDSAVGQAHLDRRIPEIIAYKAKKGEALQRRFLYRWYLFFGFVDRYLELLLDSINPDTGWTDAEFYLYDGMVYRHLGFTAQPRFLEVAEAMGLIDVWEKRGPPDFCEKVGGQWVCE